jgi:hypothetical protein
LNKLKDAIDQARVDAQRLHESIGTNAVRNHSMIRADLKNAAERAIELAASLKTLVSAQSDDTRQHVKDAATALQAAAKSAHNISAADEPELKRIYNAMLVGATAAVRGLSKAAAAKRSSLDLKS